MMQQIRNFCIIAHIDHGKSTLADRMLEMTGTIDKRQMKEQVLDQMDLERERGITIKLQPARMQFKGFILNLIDTPGHVDFSYEVSRSLAAVEGAILLVDATQGIQAQTLTTLYQAIDQNLMIIPIINKIDLPAANPEQVAIEVKKLLNCQDDDILFTSGKTGEGVSELLDRIIKVIPAPQDNLSEETRLLVFDSKYDSYRGVIAYVRVFDGQISTRDIIKMIQTKSQDQAVEVGYFIPEMKKCDIISSGEIGYVVTGFKNVAQVQVGDTMTNSNQEITPLPGYKQIQPNVYSSIFTIDSDKYPQLREALDKLKLNDAALTFEAEKSQALGFGFRCGFLGLLHLEIVVERLEREYNLDLITTTPSVSYLVELTDGSSTYIYSAGDMPDPSHIQSIQEPVAKIEIISFGQYLGNILKLVNVSRGVVNSTDYLEGDRIIIHALIPLAEIIVDFFDRLKGSTAGYSSMSYFIQEYRESDLVKMDILVAGEIVKPLSIIIPKALVHEKGKTIVEKLKNTLPKQNFAITLQAAVGGNIVARETVSAFRKDVTEKLYGGDVTRKQKLLNKQKKGKKRLAQFGKVEIPSEVFLNLLKK